MQHPAMTTLLLMFSRGLSQEGLSLDIRGVCERCLGAMNPACRGGAPAAQVSDTAVFALQALTGLQRLVLAGCGGMGNGAVGALATLTSLQHLDLHWCSFGDKGGSCCLLMLPCFLQTGFV